MEPVLSCDHADSSNSSSPVVIVLQNMWDASGERPGASSKMWTLCHAHAKTVTLLCPEAETLRKVFIGKVVSNTDLEGQGGIGQAEKTGRLILSQGNNVCEH